jgi:Tfp pilus assembly protein PilF
VVENDLNNLGYELLGQKKLKAAVQVLRVNAARYPQSWNAWDSLGEAQMKSGEKEEAIRDYRRSLELNPRNTNAREAIAKAEAK